LNYLSSGDYKGQGNVIHETFNTRANGTEIETFLWSTVGKENPYIFAIRAVDGFGNKGQFSNLVTA
jgi:hypothetical protein